MNIHISKHTLYQTWDKHTVFDEYPLYIRKGSYTITIFFKDKDAIRKLKEILQVMMEEIDDYLWSKSMAEYDEIPE